MAGAVPITCDTTDAGPMVAGPHRAARATARCQPERARSRAARPPGEHPLVWVAARWCRGGLRGLERPRSHRWAVAGLVLPAALGLWRRTAGGHPQPPRVGERRRRA